MGAATSYGTASTRGRWTLAQIALSLISVVVLGASVAGCASDQIPVVMVDNRLAIPVTVVFVNDAGTESRVIETVSAHTSYPVDAFSSDHCTPGVLIARDKSTGAEVARSKSPVCRPSRWIIEAPTASP